jgi:hypothetical protein
MNENLSNKLFVNKLGWGHRKFVLPVKYSIRYNKSQLKNWFGILLARNIIGYLKITNYKLQMIVYLFWSFCFFMKSRYLPIFCCSGGPFITLCCGLPFTACGFVLILKWGFTPTNIPPFNPADQAPGPVIYTECS